MGPAILVLKAIWQFGVAGSWRPALDGVVRNVLIGGRMAFEAGAFAEDFGRSRYGRLLRAGEKENPTTPEPVKA